MDWGSFAAGALTVIAICIGCAIWFGSICVSELSREDHEEWR